MATTVQDMIAKVRMVWIDYEDFANTGRAVFEVTPEDGLVELPRGRRGERGEKGDPANPVLWGPSVQSQDDLPTTYTERDANTVHPCYPERAIYVWSGNGWLVYNDWIGTQGETGATPQILIGRVEEGTTPQVNLAAESTLERPILNFVLPEGRPGPMGEQGPVGPAASIVDSVDYDQGKTPTVGDSLTWDGENWGPSKVVAPVGPFTLPASQFTQANVPLGSFGSQRVVVLGELNIPALPFAWRPVIAAGNVEVSTSLGVWVDIEVRLGSVSGPMIGVATGIPAQRLQDFSRIYPYYESAVTPSSTHASVEANSAATIVVLARRTAGVVGSWRTEKFRNHLTVMAQPLVTAVA